MIAANQMSSALVRTTSTATTISTTTTISVTNWLVDEISLAGCGMIISSPEKAPQGAFAKPPPSRTAQVVVVVVDQQQQTKEPEANQCLVTTTAPTSAVVAKSGDNVGTAETESPAGTVGAFVVQSSSSSNDENEPPLDDWQRSFTAFITRPSTHRHTNTGQPIARRELNTWGRQLFYKNRPRRGGAFQIATKVASRDNNNNNDNGGYPTMTIVVPTMVHLRGYVAIAFETDAETVAWGEWLAAQRALYQSRPIPPPPIVVLDDDTKNRRRHHHHEQQQGMSIRQRKKATYMYMKGTFRFGLLAQMGIDLTIPPSETLIHYDGRHNAF
jgi:hypothetical protein